MKKNRGFIPREIYITLDNRCDYDMWSALLCTLNISEISEISGMTKEDVLKFTTQLNELH